MSQSVIGDICAASLLTDVMNSDVIALTSTSDQ